MDSIQYHTKVEKWGVFEAVCMGHTDGNPFVDYTVVGSFWGKGETKTVDGFYDGDGIYKVRFMPSFEGEYSFCIVGSALDGEIRGTFVVTPAQKTNHGLMRIANTYHFAYEDGTPYYSIGTTCYVWQLQSDELITQTLQSLKESGFNKIRFCIFPKHYAYNLHEPRSYPYEGIPMDSSVLTKENFQEYTADAEGNNWNFEMFCVKHFKHIEKCILKLQKLEIEADLIMMHPYDRWGFSTMTSAEDELYFKYVIARFSAYRNIWWSLANEYDLMSRKTIKDWEHYARIICEKDVYCHLRSIHSCIDFYDYNRPWVTHCSIQRQELYRTAECVKEWRDKYRKPIVLDEIAYEGNIQYGWGNISGQEMVRRFWEAVCRGGYPGHGETYMNEEDILWWSHGGILRGESHKRVKFLLGIMKDTPGIGLTPYERSAWDEVCAVPETASLKFSSIKNYYLYYYGFMRPSFREFYFDDTTEFQIEVIDTWEMTVKDVGVHMGKFKVNLPGKEYMAIRIKKK